MFRWLVRLTIYPLIIATALYVFYTYWPLFHYRADYLYGLAFPCQRPIAYKIGTIDSQFKISPEELKKDSQDAEKIWENVAKRNLFDYKNDTFLTIDLTYDERQALTQQSEDVIGSVNQDKSTYDALEAKYKGLVASYNTKLAQYIKDVNYWNSQGGAPPAEYSRLSQEQKTLNQMVDQINSLAKQLNSLAAMLNLKVSQVNAITGEFNQTLQTKPEAGLYSPADAKIIIYQFSNREELVSTLAHEFGHALTLEHIDTTDAIMNPQRTEHTHLTDPDIAQLKAVCRL